MMYGNIVAMLGFQITIDPVAVATITTAEQTFTVPGLKLGDFVSLAKPSNTVGAAIVNCRVSAADTLAVTFVNPTAGSVNPPAETYLGLMVRFDLPRTNAVA